MRLRAQHAGGGIGFSRTAQNSTARQPGVRELLWSESSGAGLRWNSHKGLGGSLKAPSLFVGISFPGWRKAHLGGAMVKSKEAPAPRRATSPSSRHRRAPGRSCCSSRADVGSLLGNFHTEPTQGGAAQSQHQIHAGGRGGSGLWKFQTRTNRGSIGPKASRGQHPVPRVATQVATGSLLAAHG